MEKLTRKDLYRMYSYAESVGKKIVKAGNVEIETLQINPEKPVKKIGYNAGKLGWNWDLFEDEDAIYVIGYRNF